MKTLHKLKLKAAELWVTAALIPLRISDLHFTVEIFDRHSALGGKWTSTYFIPVLEDLLEGIVDKPSKKKENKEEAFYEDYEA